MNRIKQIGIGGMIGLAGIVFGSGGCETTGAGPALGFAGALLSGSASTAPNIQSAIARQNMGNAVQTLGTLQTQQDSGSQQNVHVYTGGNNGYQGAVAAPIEERRCINLITGNSYRDMNNDGIIDNRDVINPKKVFSQSEKIFCGIFLRGYKGHKLDVEITRNGELSRKIDRTIDEDGFIGGLDVPKGGLSEGKYVMDYYLDGEYLGTGSFEVTGENTVSSLK